MESLAGRKKKDSDFDWVIGPSGFLEPQSKTFRFLSLSTLAHFIAAAAFFVASSVLDLEQRGLAEGAIEVEFLGEAAPAEFSQETHQQSSQTSAAASEAPSELASAESPSRDTTDVVTAPTRKNIEKETRPVPSMARLQPESVSEQSPADAPPEAEESPEAESVLSVSQISRQEVASLTASEEIEKEVDGNLESTEPSMNDEVDEARAFLENEAKAFEETKNQDIALAKFKSQGDSPAKRTAPLSGSKINSVATTQNGSESADPRGAVRNLGDLRQMPGNPRPQYSYEERMNRIEGEVIFHAFVNPDGTLKDFKILKSSGSRSLDGKTLGALKKWRFYPNQSGWVQIPFVWTLKGEAESADGLLKTSDRTGGKWEGAVFDKEDPTPLRWKETSGGLRQTEASN